MKNTLKKLLKGINGIKNIPEIPISGISTNSALIKPGNLYIAIKGNRYDGNKFIPEAINNGASAVITEYDYSNKLSTPIIKVTNSRIAVSRAAAEYYDHPTKKMSVVGITGTNGKTSTASLLTSILKSAGKKNSPDRHIRYYCSGFIKRKRIDYS